ncbi:MAG: glycoside hydrolase domain-containing protein [Armatimonadia bacterium]
MRYMMLVLGILMAAMAIAASGAPVPVANGDFEKGLEGWNALKPSGFGNGEIKLETADVHSGKNAVRITNPAGVPKVLTGLISAAAIPLPEDSRTFAITAWMKVVSSPEAVELRIASTDKAGKALLPWQEHGWRFLRPPVEPHRGQWHQLRMEFGAQEDWGGFQLTYWINGVGADVIVDDIQIERVDPRDLLIKPVGKRLADPGAGVALWWDSPQCKIYPGQEPPAARGTGLELAAAGGEYECLQLGLRPAQELQDVTVACSELKGPGVLPAGTVYANFVGTVDVKKVTDGSTITGPTPDPLLTDKQRNLPGGQTSVVWVTVKVPAGTKAGDYTGTVTLSGKGLQAAVPLKVHIFGFDLPKQTSLRTIARIWQKHEGYEDLFRQNLADHRCSGFGAIGGQASKAVPGKDDVTVDSSGLKAAADNLLRKYGFTVFNAPGVYLGDWSGPYNKEGKWQGFQMLSPAFDAAFKSYSKQVADALRSEGILPYAIWQIWDEPHDEWVAKCAQLAKLIREAAPDAKIYLTTGIKDELIDLVDIWCLPWPSEYLGDKAEKARARGAELWAYQNELYSLDRADSSLRMRDYAWRLRKYDIRGVEWWAVSQWKSDPWTVPNQYAPQNGGGFFLYPTPDRKGAPINSIRWELYREGVEDYDILTMLKQEQDRVLGELKCADTRLSGEAQMQELVGRVAEDTANIKRDAAAADLARQEACRRIEFLQAAPKAVVGRAATAKGQAVVVVQAEAGATVVVNGKAYKGGKAEVAVPAGKAVSVTVKAGNRQKSLVL